MLQYTPRLIDRLEPHQIFVFGSNTKGIHGAGAAKMALRFGAKLRNPRGRQGQTYAIVTKDLDKGDRSIPLSTIHAEIETFIDYALGHPELEFLVTEIGCGLAGFRPAEIVLPFCDRFSYQLQRLPQNIILPESFHLAAWRGAA